ncbi:MAG: leucyl/phenylalanyl-tRNA--protein transferase [Ignavibacteriales bacterium]|nr:MAG: leucyl/phenylalanyl-tRNA--protein transferase [Ignavibacteriales bacterium]
MNTKEPYSKELLKPGNMLRLYASGAFPMADDDGKINWFMPEIRTVIPLNNYNIPRSLKTFLKKNNFEIRFDTDYLSVIKGCAAREKTWISEELIEAYKRLYKKGYIHSVETWEEGKLVGGLYGVTFRGAFFGESMFSKVPQASKAALHKLIEHLNLKDFALLDVQYMTPHLKMFGAIEIDFEEYNKLLYSAYTRVCEF